MCTVKGRY